MSINACDKSGVMMMIMMNKTDYDLHLRNKADTTRIQRLLETAEMRILQKVTKKTLRDEEPEISQENKEICGIEETRSRKKNVFNI